MKEILKCFLGSNRGGLGVAGLAASLKIVVTNLVQGIGRYVIVRISVDDLLVGVYRRNDRPLFFQCLSDSVLRERRDLAERGVRYDLTKHFLGFGHRGEGRNAIYVNPFPV